jgi:mono/diheme cytochrome c family protein
MTRVFAATLGAALIGSVLTAENRAPRSTAVPSAARIGVPVSPSAVQTRASTAPTESGTALLKQYCVSCHNDTARRGDLTLASFAVANAEEHAAVAEKIVRKLRAGMMPPPGSRRPDAAAVSALVAALETRIDEAAAARPNPGRRPFQRLNRAEYARVVHDLLAIDVDVNAYLPPDVVSSRGFDNMADDQGFSPTLMEGYLRAASALSRLAIGDRAAAPGSTVYSVPDTVSQMGHVDGAPVGTRGGVSIVHVFPADGDYSFKIALFGGPVGDLFGRATPGEQIEVSVNGERAALLDINPKMHESDPNGLSLQAPPVRIKAGPQRVSAAFIQRADGPVNDLIAPIEFTLGDTNIGNDAGITAPPHLKTLAIVGPHTVAGVSETASRRKVFTCRPKTAGDELNCATDIITRLASQAYRGNVAAEDLADLVRFYDQGRRSGDFESGIRLAIQGLMSNPRFLFRLERAPADVKAGANYRVADIDLASRLSFFLWGTGPDAALIKAASTGTLSNAAGLEQQVRRMLADPRSEALATRFAAQWLRLEELKPIRPDQLKYPQWDKTLVDAAARETELLFDSLVREDRGVLDLITADYTFVNARLARHYGIPNVMGNAFQRVRLPDENRRGVLGHASMLMLTSVADRTSPVIRGKWVMNVLLGTPPPPPPPNVPSFEETKDVKGERVLSVRERMEEHRSNPACTSCHRVIDPLGLALENFDAIGMYRVRDGEKPVDPTGVLYDGTPLDGPASLRQALLTHADVLILSFTENLMTYALGRPVEYYDMPAIRKIVRDAARNDNRMSSFVVGVVKSPAFQMSRADELPTTEAGAGNGRDARR